MNKTKEFIRLITILQCSPPENLELLIKWVEESQPITFFSWKMFKISLEKNTLTADSTFDIEEAQKFIKKETDFLNGLSKLGIQYNYFKIVPDELPSIFFKTSFPSKAKSFAKQIQSFYSAQVLLMSEILRLPGMQVLYDKVFSDSARTAIPQDKLLRERLLRSTYYSTRPLPFKQSQRLSLKAFGLFAAETAVIWKYFSNPVLLAGERSVDTYKYEFYKYPIGRPILPKLFVL